MTSRIVPAEVAGYVNADLESISWVLPPQHSIISPLTMSEPAYTNAEDGSMFPLELTISMEYGLPTPAAGTRTPFYHSVT